jgi:phage-related protein (TIGR01555 family)
MRDNNTEEVVVIGSDTRSNALADLVGVNPMVPTAPFGSETIAQPWTFAEGSAYTPFTLNRIALSYGYMTYGLVQAVIDMVVEDAFRGGLDITIPEMDTEDVKKLHEEMELNGDIEAIKMTAKWARLFGGSGMIAATDQDPSTPMKPLKEGDRLQFIAADRWELLLTALSISGNQYGVATWQSVADQPYNYYGIRMDSSRVIRMLGKEAPSFIRQRLQGWGMSELERCIREINSYIKFQNLLFELTDEAKIDVYGIEQFNEQLATAQGTAAIQLRIQLSNMLKNYKNALVMDKEDTYDQKQIAFGGLADIFQEFRVNLASALKIPTNKLFGQSATGLGSGEDSMENYNSMVEADVRPKTKPMIKEAISMRCMTVFGYVPKFTFKFHPLRVLSGVEEEAVKTSKQNRALALADRDFLSGQEAMESLHKDGLINVESEVLNGTREPISPLALEEQSVDQAGEAAAAKSKEKKDKQNGLERLKAMLDYSYRRKAA